MASGGGLTRAATERPVRDARSSLSLARDVVHAARLWPLWVRLGVQDVRLRFRRSVLGMGWIFLHLAIMILAVGAVYGALLGQDLRRFLPSLTASLVVWSYLTASVVEGGLAFVASEGYIKQINAPLFVYVFRFLVRTTIPAMLSSLAYLVVAAVSGVPLRRGSLWVLAALPAVMLTSFLLITISACLTAHLRDVTHMSSLLLQVLFYLTPILWPADLLRQRGMAWVVDGNPLYHLLEVVRHPLVVGEPATAVNYAAVGGLLIGLAVAASAIAARDYRRVVYLL